MVENNPCDFFISYNSKDKVWAEWIAWILEEEGYSIRLQAWDFKPGNNFVLEMNRWASHCSRIIIVLSDNYLESGFTKAEWSVFFARDPTGENRIVVPIRVSDCTPPAILKTTVYLDMCNLDKSSAQSLIINSLENINDRDVRVKPKTSPSYPGQYETHINKETVTSLLCPIDVYKFREALRGRYLQVALDVSELHRAEEIANIAARFPSVIIEVGDPLIKRFGMESVRRIRNISSSFPLLVELSSSDWAGEQVEIAAQAGADIVLLLGIKERTRIEEAVNSARKNKIGIFLAMPLNVRIDIGWCKTVTELGVDAIAIIRNIDSSITGRAIIKKAQAVRKISTLPIVLSGGFTISQIKDAIDIEWNIIIVGRAIINANNHKEYIQDIISIIQGSGYHE